MIKIIYHDFSVNHCRQWYIIDDDTHHPSVDGHDDVIQFGT